MDKVLVTGGTGFVGYWMGLEQPEKTDCYYLDRQEYAGNGWENEGKPWSYIVHLAPVYPKRVIEYCKKYNARLLYCSSGIVYYPENNSEYRQMKLMGEQECLNSGVDVVIARLFTFFGERLDDNKAYTQFTKAAKQNSDIEIWGDGSTVRSYMHGSELGRWMWAILFNGQSGEAYDVGSDEPVTTLELAEQIKAIHHSTSRIVFIDHPVPMPHYLPKDTAKTRKLMKTMIK